MKAPCLTDLLNHTFPLDHCCKGTGFASSLHVLWELLISELPALSTAQYFFPKHVKSFEPAWLHKIWLNLLDLWVDILHIEGLHLILAGSRGSSHERCSPSAFQILLFSSWKIVMTLRGSLRGSKLLWTLFSATGWAQFAVALKNHYKK